MPRLPLAPVLAALRSSLALAFGDSCLGSAGQTTQGHGEHPGKFNGHAGPGWADPRATSDPFASAVDLGCTHEPPDLVLESDYLGD